MCFKYEVKYDAEKNHLSDNINKYIAKQFKFEAAKHFSITSLKN